MYTQLLRLPPPLLLLLCTTTLAPTASSQAWPYNLPPYQKYWPEHEMLVRRDAEVRQQLITKEPSGMRKMSDDPNEMFFLGYWQFDPPSNENRGGEAHKRSTSDSTQEQSVPSYSNATVPLPPLLLHTPDLTLRHLFKRDFQCPVDTNPCTSISRPNSCCPKSTTCVSIPDNGIGDVGCCPAGQKCSGSVSSCDTSMGYTSCPNSGNGGCCIPGFACNGIGCASGGGTSTVISNVIVTVTVTPGSMTVTSTSTPPTSSSTITSTSTSTSSSTTPPAPPPAPLPTTSTTTTTLPQNTTTDIVSINSVTQGTLTCSPGFQTCAPSLSGGCCPSDRVCGTGGLCLAPSTTSSSSSAAVAPPVRPTSASTSSMGICPTGYYMCSATYIPGCCQIGRNCDTTSCPPSATNTVVTSGVTIVVPGEGTPTTIGSITGDSDTAASATTTGGAGGAGICAQGFASCAASVGGGCCPSGFVCGEQCTATTGGNAVGKAPPLSEAVVVNVTWTWLGAIVGVGMGILGFVL